MNYNDVEKLIDKARKQPKRVMLIVFIIILFSIVTPYITAFISKKAEQHASTQSTLPKTNTQKFENLEQKNDPLRLPPDYSSRPIPKNWGLIICIENYLRLPKVEYARKDAFTVRDYFIRILGIPKENIVSLIDSKATKSQIGSCIREYFPKNLSKDATLFVYFSGHGMPGTKKGEPYLVPYDADSRFIEQTGFKLSSFYQELYRLELDRVYVFLDSCFSGVASRASEMLNKGTRPTMVHAEKINLPSSSIISLNATSTGQISHALPEQGHGLFTYYLLRGLRGEADTNADGWASMKEIYGYVHTHVLRDSRRMQSEQAPSIIPPTDHWKDVEVSRSIK